MKNKIRFVFFILLFAFSITGKAQDAKTLYNEGLQLKKDQKIQEALQKFKSAVALQKNYKEAIYESGWCYNDLKMYSDAMSALKEARKYWPDMPKVHFELAYAFEKSYKYDSALAIYRRCLELKPDYALAYKRIGEVYYQQEDYKRTLEEYQRYEYNTTNTITDYLYWYHKGFANNALKDYYAAKTALMKSEELKKDYINTYFELGFASSKLKQDEEAIGYFNKAMNIEPKNHISYNGIAEVYRDNKKNMDEAMNWYRKSLDLKPNERKANFGMGYCLNSKNKYQEAISYLTNAIENERNYTAAYVELGYSQFKTRRYDEALKNFAKALELNPKNENARYYSGLLYIERKDKAKAQKMVDELKDLSSKNAAALQTKVNEMNLNNP